LPHLPTDARKAIEALEIGPSIAMEFDPSKQIWDFPDTWMVIFNSFRHTFQNPGFRVVILTTDRLTPAAYKRIWDANSLNDRKRHAKQLQALE
jgi:hypothetical protein